MSGPFPGTHRTATQGKPGTKRAKSRKSHDTSWPLRKARFQTATDISSAQSASLPCAVSEALAASEPTKMPKPTAQPRIQRNPGLCPKRGTDPPSKFAGLGEARPASGETRYFSPVVVRDRRAEVTLGPQVATSETVGRQPEQSRFRACRGMFGALLPVVYIGRLLRHGCFANVGAHGGSDRMPRVRHHA